MSEREFWIAIRAGILGLLAVVRRHKQDDPFWMEMAGEIEGVAAVIARQYGLGKNKPKPVESQPTEMTIYGDATVQLTEEQVEDLR